MLALAGVTCARSGPTRRASSSGSGTYSVTPHTSYSSSVGVLGCKIDYNRVAYWPMEVDCDSMCIKLTNNGKSLTVLHVDTSGGAYDISYDAWSQLNCGVPGSAQTCVGGGVDMQCKSWKFILHIGNPSNPSYKYSTDKYVRRMGRHVPMQRHSQQHRQAAICCGQLHEPNFLVPQFRRQLDG